MRIAIIGAGLNGLSCAVFLRSLGFECEVFERGDAPRDSGTGIYVWPQGAQILRVLLGDRHFSGYGQPVEYLDTHSNHGALLSSQAVRPDGSNVMSPAMMFRRKDLYRMLQERVPAGSVHFGDAVESIDVDRGHPVARFASGRVREFDLVIGTDGLNSAVRRFVNPHAKPRYAGLVASRGVVKFRAASLSAQRCQIFVTRFARVVTYSLDESDSLRYWFAAYRCDPGAALLDRNGLLRKFSDLPPFILDMLGQTPKADINSQRLYTLTAEGAWHRAGVVLLGDSVHAMLPTLGYGFTLGLENTVALGLALAGASALERDAALQRYEARCAARSRELISVMNDMTRLYYFEPPARLTVARIGPIVSRFNTLAADSVF